MDVSVIVPTYNRCEILALTLRSLARQDLPRHRYEVIVGDDGSSDGTPAMVATYRERLNVTYRWQEDKGFRVAAARNLAAAGARGRVLVFVDSGEIVDPGFVGAHLRAHDDAHDGPGRVVVGYVYGYAKLDARNGFDPEELRGGRPEDLIAAARARGEVADLREETFRQVGDDLERLAAPWVFCWTSNVSVRADTFRAVGGFDEDFVGWGGEDTEFGCRLHEAGARFVLERRAVTIEYPHPRDREANLRTHERNQDVILREHPRPLVEAATVCRARVLDARWRELGEALVRRRAALSGPVAPPASTIATSDTRVVFGADDPRIAPHVDLCVEPDAALLARWQAAHPGGRVLRLFGFRTLLPAGGFDECLLPPSLRCYPGWAVELLEREATRIARRVTWLEEGCRVRPA